MIHAEKLIKDGADIIDIGAESTRPNAETIDIDFEIEKLTPIVKELKKQNIKISIDTRNHKTAEKMIELGVDIINDVSNLNYDSKMVDIIKNSNVSYILCHSRGIPQNMDEFCNYKNAADEIYEELFKKSQFLIDEGIEKERIIIDVGFGFAKNIEQNFELLKRIKEFNSLGFKNLAGLSRKRFIKSLANDKNLEIQDDLTMLASFYLIQENVDIIRVHNVQKTKTALDFYNAIYSQKPYP
ncbi:TPA: dihydropteroate synthase [Candidatus Galligastranaerophilus intestinigallinarum]|nr:dihydropteroate synthase [Candidatus Galligastranaerophilus intestinigallinarum]